MQDVLERSMLRPGILALKSWRDVLRRPRRTISSNQCHVSSRLCRTAAGDGQTQFWRLGIVQQAVAQLTWRDCLQVALAQGKCSTAR
jgi:hypothetical protein